MFYFFLNKGALTSSNTRYSYRGWDCEKIESFDPFDASGLSIGFTTYSNFIIKAVPIVSKYISWCTDKARYVLDSFRINKCTGPFVKYFKNIDRVVSSTWCRCIIYINIYLCAFSLYNYINFYKKHSYFLYDLYTSSLELYEAVNFFKRCSALIFLDTFLYVFGSLCLYLGFYKSIYITRLVKFYLIYCCSLFNINYSYIYLMLSQHNRDVYIIGFIHVLLRFIKHEYVSISRICYYIMTITNNTSAIIFLIDAVLIKYGYDIQTLYEYFYVNFISYKFFIAILCLKYLYENINILNIFELNKMINYYVLVPYSYYYIERITPLFLYDQIFSEVYLCFNVDYIFSSIRSVANILFTHFIVSYRHMYDLLVPIYLYIETSSANIDIYGSISIYDAVIIQPILFSIYSIVWYYSVVYLNYKYYISSVLIFDFFCRFVRIMCSVSYLCWRRFIFMNYMYVYVMFRLYYFILTSLEGFLYKYRLIMHSIHYYCVILYNLEFKYTLLINSYHVDSCTYFLTGTCCYNSRFLSRFRYNGGIYDFTLI